MSNHNFLNNKNTHQYPAFLFSRTDSTIYNEYIFLLQKNMFYVEIKMNSFALFKKNIYIIYYNLFLRMRGNLTPRETL
jgi:hypothetical protein